jgi:diguanylate cyclase (GGDEF)-like protein/PAS domain S-box-containing protein
MLTGENRPMISNWLPDPTAQPFGAISGNDLAYLRAMIDSLPLIAWLKDSAGRYLAVNQAFARHLIMADAELLIGKTDQDFLPQEQAEKIRASDADVMTSRQSISVEEKAVRRGRIFWILATRTPIIDEQGNILGIVGHAQDITSYKEVEIQLRERGLVLDAIVKNIPHMIFLKRASDLRFELFNRAGEELLGCRQEDLLGRSDYDLFSQQEADFFTSKDRETLACGDVVDIPEETIQTPSGKRILHTKKIALHNDEGVAQYLLGISADITEQKQAEAALLTTYSHLAEAQQIAQLGYWTLDLIHGELIWSADIYRLFEIDPDKFIATYEGFLQTVHPDDRDAVDQAYAASLASQTPYEIVHRLLMSDGRIKWVHERCISEFDPSGTPLRSIGTVQDITDRMEAEADQRIAAAAFDAQQGIIVTDAHGVIVRVNRALLETTGYTAEELIGQTPRIFKSGRHDTAFYTKMWRDLLENGSWQGEIWDRRKNGEIFPKWLSISPVKDRNGITTHFVGSQIDISERIASEEKIRSLAFYDSLTGLPNRRLLTDWLQQALDTSLRGGHEGALLFIDLDNFKTINDTLGHSVGDMLLQEVARRLVASLRTGDTVARLGGDEFVVVIENLAASPRDAANQAKKVGEKVLDCLGGLYRIADYDVRSTPSIGITLFGNQREGIEELLKQADMAMYQAKAAGRNTMRFFDPEFQAMLSLRVALEADLRLALQEQQFELYYQPQLDAELGVIGAEALIRWRHPQRGIVSPAEFIPIAEDTGLILPLGLWVLQTACTQLKSWESNKATAGLTLAVNVSARQFHQPEFFSHVEAILDRSGVDASKFELELTESMLLDITEETIAAMNQLKQRGARFCLDDFGTGYSSLSYLRRLPISQLKIDQSFVREVVSNPNDAIIARSIIALAQNMQMSVIAEGVETEAQRAFLAANGCATYQGYLFSKPLPIAEFERLLPQTGYEKAEG